MKKTILYYDTYKNDIPCTVDDMRLVSVTPINQKQKQYECVYRSMSTYELAESIAQKHNKESLERIKNLTLGYTGKIFKGKYTHSTQKIVLWGGKEQYKCPFIDEYKTFESKRNPFHTNGKPKYLYKDGNRWRVKTVLNGEVFSKGTFNDYEKACEASHELCEEIIKWRLDNNLLEIHYDKNEYYKKDKIDKKEYQPYYDRKKLLQMEAIMTKEGYAFINNEFVKIKSAY